MKVVIGNQGAEETWQRDFATEVDCVHADCNGTARLGFVSHEIDEEEPHVYTLYNNDPDGEGYWLHDSCAVAVYFCRKCLKPTAKYNQA